MSDRDWNSPQYQRWRAAVRKRDKGCCRMPGCKIRRGLKCHHIRRWADAPGLRYALDNGVTLCPKHHKQVEGQEETFEGLFRSLVGGGSDLRLRMILAKARAKNDADGAHPEAPA